MKKTELESRVRALLDNAGVTKAPISVKKVARSLQIEIRFAPTKPDVSGALIVDGESAYIAVNDAHHENRQRFTIAHELGHFCLHKEGDRIHFDEDFRVYKRSGRSALATDSKEIQANQFAAELLMPTNLLWEDFHKSQGLEPRIVESLALKYKVSRDAMKFRLQNLGLILPEVG